MNVFKKPSRFKTLLFGLLAGVAYAFLAMLLLNAGHSSVSITYIFVVPVIMGAIPVLFSTREQLDSYTTLMLIPWGIVFLFFLLAWIHGFEGVICLVAILGPFIVLGTLGAFIFRMARLKRQGKGTKLYASLFIPFLVFFVEQNITPGDRYETVVTSVEINANKSTVWENIKNVKNIQSKEIQTHLVHLIGVPKPLNGELDTNAIGGTRHITWEKGIMFEEKIKSWEEGIGFSYDIRVDARSIPPETLDEHVVIGGKYFDVTEGSYRIDPVNARTQLVTLTCTYRITTSLNFYSKWWADFLLDDFNQMILEVIKKRSEAIPSSINPD